MTETEFFSGKWMKTRDHFLKYHNCEQRIEGKHCKRNHTAGSPFLLHPVLRYIKVRRQMSHTQNRQLSPCYGL